MRKIHGFAVGVLALSLAACGSETSGTIEGEDGETGEYTINRSTGETTATIETDEGTATLRSGANIDVDLPGGFTPYPGASVISNTEFSQGDGAGAMLLFQTSDSPDAVIAFYRQQADDAGITIELDAKINGGAMLAGESEDGLTFSINANPGAEGTSAQLAIGNKLD